MKTRRQFIKFSIKFLAGLGAFFNTMGKWLAKAYAETKRILLPKGTDLSTLSNKNPANLDTRNLEVRPLKDFETMGLDDHKVNLKSWRLIVEGNVDAATKLTYSGILELPSIERFADLPRVLCQSRELERGFVDDGAEPGPHESRYHPYYRFRAAGLL